MSPLEKYVKSEFMNKIPIPC